MPRQKLNLTDAEKAARKKERDRKRYELIKGAPVIKKTEEEIRAAHAKQQTEWRQRAREKNQKLKRQPPIPVDPKLKKIIDEMKAKAREWSKEKKRFKRALAKRETRTSKALKELRDLSIEYRVDAKFDENKRLTSVKVEIPSEVEKIIDFVNAIESPFGITIWHGNRNDIFTNIAANKISIHQRTKEKQSPR